MLPYRLSSVNKKGSGNSTAFRRFLQKMTQESVFSLTEFQAAFSTLAGLHPVIFHKQSQVEI